MPSPSSTRGASASSSTPKPRRCRRSAPRSASTTSASPSSTPATSPSPPTRGTRSTPAGRSSPKPRPELLPLLPDLGFAPDLEAIPAALAAQAKLMFVNYPNNPTGAVVPEGFFERVVEFAREHEILVVHDNAYSETTYDGYVAPSFLATPGARRGRGRGLLTLQGLQHDRLALRRDPRQRRGDRDLLAAEDEHRLRPLRGRPAGRRRGAVRAARAAGGDERDLRPPPRPGRLRAARDRRRGHPAEGARSTSGRRFPGATPRPPSPSSCSKRPRWWSRPARCTGRAARASFGSR